MLTSLVSVLKDINFNLTGIAKNIVCTISFKIRAEACFHCDDFKQTILKRWKGKLPTNGLDHHAKISLMLSLLEGLHTP